MNTITIQPPKGISLEEAKIALKNLKFKIIEKTDCGQNEEKNTYSEDFAKKIRQARKERQRGETIKISSENLWELTK